MKLFGIMFLFLVGVFGNAFSQTTTATQTAMSSSQSSSSAQNTLVERRVETQPTTERWFDYIPCKDGIFSELKKFTRCAFFSAVTFDLGVTGSNMNSGEGKFSRNYVSRNGTSYFVDYVAAPLPETNPLAKMLGIQNNRPMVLALGAAGDFFVGYGSEKAGGYLSRHHHQRIGKWLPIVTYSAMTVAHIRGAISWNQPGYKHFIDKHFPAGGYGPYPDFSPK